MRKLLYFFMWLLFWSVSCSFEHSRIKKMDKALSLCFYHSKCYHTAALAVSGILFLGVILNQRSLPSGFFGNLINPLYQRNHSSHYNLWQYFLPIIIVHLIWKLQQETSKNTKYVYSLTHSSFPLNWYLSEKEKYNNLCSLKIIKLVVNK